MSWNPNNQPPTGAPVNPNFASTNVGEITSTGSDASTTPPFLPSAPNRAQLNTEGVIAVQTSVPQQGTVKTTTNYKTDYSGIGAGGVAGYKWF